MFRIHTSSFKNDSLVPFATKGCMYMGEGDLFGRGVSDWDE